MIDLEELNQSEEEAMEPFQDGRKIYSQGDCPRCWEYDDELVTVDPVCDDSGVEIARQCRECNWGYLVHSETLWLRPGQRKLVGRAARLIEKGVVCWPLMSRGLLLARPIRMFGEGRGVPIRQTK